LSLDTPYGPREILDNGKYGALLPYDSSAENFAKALLKSLDQAYDKALLSQRAGDFFPEKIAKQYLSLVGL
jgi:glycosyltransferase involved in cell wall biosynthesis